MWRVAKKWAEYMLRCVAVAGVVCSHAACAATVSRMRGGVVGVKRRAYVARVPCRAVASRWRYARNEMATGSNAKVVVDMPRRGRSVGREKAVAGAGDMEKVVEGGVLLPLVHGIAGIVIVKKAWCHN